MTATASSARKLLKLAASALEKRKGNETLGYCQQVLKAHPNHPRALYLMGKVYFAAGHYDKAVALLQQAIAVDPQEAEHYMALCKVLTVQDKGNEAVQVAHKATQIAPYNPDTHGMLAFLFLHFDHAHLVPDYLEKIMPQLKESVELLQYYAIALKINERGDEADSVYQDIMKRYRIPASFQVMYETYLPRLLLSTEEIDRKREDFVASLDRFIREKPHIDVNMLSMHPLFKLAYHNRDNKELMRKYTQMLRACAPELNYVASHCQEGKTRTHPEIRVGFASRHMHDHPVGRCYRNLLTALHAHEGFRVSLFVIDSLIDPTIKALRDKGVEIISLPKNLASAQNMVAEHQLDILIYPDIGMDAMTHYLAMARLARYQCCLLGHPDTTGIDTVDYCISSRLYETENAQAHYTETLLLNDGIDTLFQRPATPEIWHTRKELGLPEDRKLYVCPMAIQKLHPDFDGVLAGILEKDPQATLVLFNDYQLKSASERLQQRILQHCERSRVIFLDWQPIDRLWSILKTADAVLVTIYFGAGTTAQYAFSYGIPMVTMPDQYVRSRVVYAYYKALEIEDAPVAHSLEGYVSIAVRLANDPAYKVNLSRQLLVRNNRLFENSGYEDKVAELMRDIVDQKLEKYLT